MAISFEGQLLSLLNNGVLNLATPGLLAKDLALQIPNLDLSQFEDFPQLLTAAKIKGQKAKNNPILLPASALILAEKSKNVAGLLHELDELITQPVAQFPPSLQALLGQEIPLPSETSKVPTDDHSPTQLSPSQQQLVRAANDQPLTVCHGPPGTGKTFTVAATTMDQVSRGQSVLIACRSEEAAAVIEAKLNEMLPKGQLVIRAGRSEHLRKLKSQLDQLLGARPTPPPLPSAPAVSLGHLNRTLTKLRRKLKNRLISETKAAPLFHTPPEGFIQKLRHWKHCQLLKRVPLLSELVAAIISTQARRLNLLNSYNEVTYHRNLQGHLSSLASRRILLAYREAVGRRIPASQERELLEVDLGTLLNYLPIWITTTDDIHRVLPLKPGIFDLVIIDEATQCDLASALPILYRGNRAFITGDPQQLRHLSFLSKERLDSLAVKNQLPSHAREQYDFRRVSFLDRALAISARSGSLNFLDEHFRSVPPLIAFSNKHFYNDNLHCMREVETLAREKRDVAFVTNSRQGVRNKDGVNESEIICALSYLRKVLMSSQDGSPVSIGFLSPFRAQVDAFQERLQKELSPSLQQRLLHQHQLIAGTAHSFQGAERDIMLISLVIDASSPSAARRFLERPDVFNVSITRARHQIQLITSLAPAELPAGSLLRQYLLHAASQTSAIERPSNNSEHVPPDLISQFESRGWQKLAVGGEVAGMPTDLLFRKNGRLVAVDLVGTPDQLGGAVSVEKTLLLGRAGLPLHPLSLAEWHHRGKDFLKAIDGI